MTCEIVYCTLISNMLQPNEMDCNPTLPTTINWSLLGQMTGMANMK